MLWNFLKKSWLFPIHDAPRRRRRKAPPARPRAQLSVEQLESRMVPTTITRTSASIFSNDLPSNLTSAYASYQITNTDGVNYPDVWVSIGNFTAASGSPVVTLAPGAPGAIDVGPLANGQTKTAFFYLGSDADTTVTQTHTVSVFNGPPASGSLLTSQDFSFTSVQSTIQGNSNKVDSVVVSPSTPTVGGTFTITVTGETGTIGAGNVLDFTPAAYSSWQAGSFQLIGSTITFSGGNSGTFTNTLAIPPGSITSTANSNYTAVYTFQVVGTTATPAAVSPVEDISSGNNVKHTDTGNFATLPPVRPPMLASPTLNAAPTPATVTLGATAVTLNDTAVLEDGSQPSGTITFTLVGPGNTLLDTETVAVSGDGTYSTPTGFTLPGSGTVTGTYQWNATYSGDSNNNAASVVNSTTEQVTVSAASLAAPSFANLTGGSIPFGASSVNLSGQLATTAATPFPSGSVVTVTINGVAETAALNADGSFQLSYQFSQALAVSQSPYAITYAYTDRSGQFAPASDSSQALTVTPATPTASVADAGGTYNGSAFAATATVAGVDNTPAATLEGVAPTLSYYRGSYTSLGQLAGLTPLAGAPVQAGAYTVLASFAGSADYSGGQALTSFTIAQASPTVSVSDAGGTYDGSAFPATARVNGAGSLEGVPVTLDYQQLDGSGKVVADLGSTAPSTAGSYQVSATFAGSTDYAAASASAAFSVGRASPTVTWASPADITYGTALSSTQLDATANVPGTFAYSPDFGTVLGAGMHTLSVTFTPTDTADYNSVTQTATLNVLKATPTGTWANPAAIVSGTPLGAAQLDATADPGPGVTAVAYTTIVQPSPVLEDVALVWSDPAVQPHFALVRWGDGRFNIYSLGDGGGVAHFQHGFSRHTQIKNVVVHVYLCDAQFCLGALLGGASAAYH
jgi:hypothetical protein